MLGDQPPVGDTLPVGNEPPNGDQPPVGDTLPVGEETPNGDKTPVGDEAVVGGKPPFDDFVVGDKPQVCDKLSVGKKPPSADKVTVGDERPSCDKAIGGEEVMVCEVVLVGERGARRRETAPTRGESSQTQLCPEGFGFISFRGRLAVRGCGAFGRRPHDTQPVA